jgi:hypothetical protein
MAFSIPASALFSRLKKVAFYVALRRRFFEDLTNHTTAYSPLLNGLLGRLKTIPVFSESRIVFFSGTIIAAKPFHRRVPELTSNGVTP